MKTYLHKNLEVTEYTYQEYLNKRKMRIDYKPLTANRMWKGRRFKTDEYKRYERDLLFLLPKYHLPLKPFSISLIFGVSTLNADIDNPVKPLLDILQKKYGFNDRDIMQATIQKRIVKKGCEYINFSIEHFES
jgi:Holliday junction resolvase RusA-like endonuclease